MDMDEDDDIYVPEEPQVDTQQAQPPIATKPAEELEEGEEEDEGGAMDEDDDDSVWIDALRAPKILSNLPGRTSTLLPSEKTAQRQHLQGSNCHARLLQRQTKFSSRC